MTPKTQKTILTTAVVLLISIMVGKYIMVPATATIDSKWMYLPLGIGAMSTVYMIRCMIERIIVNRRLIKAIQKTAKKTIRYIGQIGVTTPMEFAYAMHNILYYIPLPILTLNNFTATPTLYNNNELWRLASEKFMAMFGRQPMAADETRNWVQISKEEAALSLGMQPSEVEYKTIEAHVNPKLYQYFRKGGGFESDMQEVLKK